MRADRAVYVKKKGVLSLWDRKTSPIFWQEHWHQLTDDQLRHVLRPTKYMWPSLGRVLLRWLPKDGIILDAGCGMGRMVRRLQLHGLNCIGLDYAVPSLIHSNAVCPALPFVGGDLLQLPFADECFTGIFSIGVFEHFEDGPNAALQEMNRVLKPGGVLCLTVPYENQLRRNLTTMSEKEAVSQGLEFYQYYFTPSHLKTELERVGLQSLEPFSTYDVFQGLQEHTHWFKRSVGLIPKSKYWSFLLDFIPRLSDLAGHMMAAVAVKK